ncbi:30S ribosomal protein S17 [Planoprotostelium fungivorum]|uniref:30S ribosomal protein S17 n=1 Tax=Planoprotostelium fungivorum TaxID=1890364 RepID=A0A2P6MSK6_9EUKA|nr:30S ribosomal protein S17 [Planoprotostelium fungivorum]
MTSKGLQGSGFLRNGFAAGTVISAKLMNKTIKVAVPRVKIFKGRQIARLSRFMVHDENNEADIGDKVLIKQCLRITQNKHHKLHTIFEKDPTAAYAKEHPEFLEYMTVKQYDALPGRTRGLPAKPAVPPGNPLPEPDPHKINIRAARKESQLILEQTTKTNKQ